MSDKIRSSRVSQDVSVQLVTMQPGAATAAAEPARTLELSEHGAMIECLSNFELGADVMVHNPKTLQNDLFKVFRTNLAPSGSAWNVALELQAADDPDFWRAS